MSSGHARARNAAAARVQARREAGTAILHKANFAQARPGARTPRAKRAADSTGHTLEWGGNRGDLRQNRYDRNSTVIIILSVYRIFLKPVASLHSLSLEDGLSCWHCPPARFQLPPSWECRSSPPGHSSRYLSAFAPGPPARGLFFRGLLASA